MSPKERYKYGIRTRWGRDSDENILWLTQEHHELIHRIFGNRTWEEIISILQRVARMKGRQT